MPVQEFRLPPPRLGKLLCSPGGRATAIIASCVLATLVITVTVAQKVVDHEKQTVLNAHAKRVLERAGDVADHVTSILRKARRLDTAPCSAEDLDQLRTLNFESRFVRDVVRLEHGAMTCSAAWGRLDKAFQLPPSHHGTAPFRFWRDIKIAPGADVRSDITARGSIAVVTAPGAFDRLEPTVQDVAKLAGMSAMKLPRFDGHLTL